MPRLPRRLIIGATYHVTARGNYRQQVFFDSVDYAFYLKLLAWKSTAFGLEVMGWCLMPNHVHLLVREGRPGAMANTLRGVHGSYATYLNHKREQPSGHVWQGRYYSSPVPANRIWTVLRYIELNPVRAKLSRDAADFEWSTGRYHLGAMESPPMLHMADWRFWWTEQQWREALSTGLDAEEEGLIRRAAKRGRWEEPG